MKLKNILLESELDQAAEGLFNTIKPTIGSFKNYDELYILDHGKNQGAFDLELSYEERPMLDYPYDITAYGEGGDVDMPGDLNIVVQYNPNDFPLSLNGLEAEIYETLRHELEHIGQQSFDDMFVVANEPNKDFDSYENYLMQSNEIPAYVQGLVTRAVYKKITLDQAMEEWHTENIKNFENSGKQGTEKADWSRIKKAWMNWAKANKDNLKKHDMSEDLRKWFKQKWVNIGKKDKSGKHPECGTSGKKRGYAKCVPAAKARGMSKKEKESATRRKRAAQNKAGKGGKKQPGQGNKPIKVKTKVTERLELFLEKNIPTDPSKWSYYKSQAKKKFDVYPSAYANGWAAKKYKAAGGGWKKG